MKKINEHELAELLRDSRKLHLLEMGGVDNWEWYEDIMDEYEDKSDEELTYEYNEAN